MKKYEEMIGKKFGHLTVIGVSSRTDKYGHKYLDCKCDCGNFKTIVMHHIISGASQSCGCGVSKSTIKRNTTHGGTGTRLYTIWLSMRKRCTNSKEKDYQYYGAKGIKISSEWSTFDTFRDWSLSHGYDDSLTIDRIDVNGDYCPSNCRWITFAEQCRNRTNNRQVTINGEAKLITDWIKESPVSMTTVYDRMRKGWPVEDALFITDRRKIRRIR